MTYYFGRPDSIPTIRDAVHRYGSKEFESPTRSTIPMLSLLMDGHGMFDDIVQKLGMPTDCDLYLEYTVSPPRGRGKASHTDVMLKSGPNALAIEAKWTEPMYETVNTWLDRGMNEPNKRNVLEGWLSLLYQHSKQQLEASTFGEAIYQMVHRAASAADAGDNPRLAYFIFKPSPDPKSATSGDISRELKTFWDNLGSPATFPFSVVEIMMDATEEYRAMAHLPKGETETSELVIAALVDEAPLFRFSKYVITKTGVDNC